MYPEDYLYSKDHEWVQVEGDQCTIGITHFAQDELGEVVFVDLPEVGQNFAAHEEIGTIESVKAVAEIYTPLAGELVAVNSDLEVRPEAVNEAPHTKGWLIKLKIRSESELDDLMNAAEYKQFTETGDQ